MPASRQLVDQDRGERASASSASSPGCSRAKRSKAAWIAVPRASASTGSSGPVQRPQPQDVAGVDGVGVADPALDAGHRQLARPRRQRRRRAWAAARRAGAERSRRIERAGPGEQRRAAPGSASPAPLARVSSRHSQREATAGAPPRRSAMHQHHLRRAGGLGEVVGGQADAALGRRQAERRAHRPRQERIDRRGPRPDALLQPGQDQPVGADQPRLEGAQDAQARMAGAAGAHHFAGHQGVDQLDEAGAGDLRAGPSLSSIRAAIRPAARSPAWPLQRSPRPP